MSQEEIISEAVNLAREIIAFGPEEGRGMRLANLVLNLDEVTPKGIPVSWASPEPSKKPSAYPTVPGVIGTEKSAAEAIPDPDELDKAWDQMFSIPPPPGMPREFPSSFPKSQARITKSPKPRITLAPPESQPDEIIELSSDDIELVE